MTPAVGKLTPDQRRQIATHFIATAKWSRLSMRGGSATAANDGVSRVTMRVFAKGCPAGCLRDVLQILAEKTPVLDPLLDATLEPGEWHHKAAWWGKDSQSSKNGDATLTIFRELSDGPVSETNVVEDGCGSRTSIRFVWDATAVEIIEGTTHSDEQGFSVRIGGVTRDRETELYSYYVTTTERKTQLVPAYATGDDAFSTDYDASWLGLRGTTAAPTDDEGDGVSVWDPAVQALGESLGVQWSRNLEDCTLNAQGRRKVAKQNVLSSKTCARDLFAEQDTDATSGVTAQLGHAPAPAGGVSWQYQSKLRPDRLWDTVKAKDTELPVAQAQVSVNETVSERVETVTDRAQGADPAPASAAGGVIRATDVDKTKGGLKNVRVVTKTEKPLAAARVTKSADVFGTSVSTVDRHQSAAPADPTAGAGVTRETSTEVTEGGLKNNVSSSKTENFVAAAQVTEQRTLFKRSVRTTDKSSPGSRPAATAAGGAGVSSSAQTTPGGRTDIVTDEEQELFVGAATVADQVTVFDRIHSYTDANSTGAVPPAVAAGGFIREATASTNPLGSKNIQVQERTELPVTDATVAESGDLFHDSTESVDRHQADPGPGGQGNTEPGKLKTRNRSKTPGGLVDVSDREVTYKGVAEAAKSLSGSMSESQESVTAKNQMALPAVTTGYVGPGLPIKSLRWNKTPANQYDHELGTDTPGPFREHTVASLIDIGGAIYNEYTVTFLNATEAQVTGIASRYLDYHVVPGYNWNKFGLMSGQIKFTPWALRGGGGGDSELIDEGPLTEEVSHIVERDGVTYNRVFTSTFYFKRDWGVSGGFADYSGAKAGSHFRPLGNDRYEYKKVTAISVTESILSTPLSGASL